MRVFNFFSLFILLASPAIIPAYAVSSSTDGGGVELFHAGSAAQDTALTDTSPQRSGSSLSPVAGAAALFGVLCVIGGAVSYTDASFYKETCCKKPYGHCCPDCGSLNCTKVNAACSDCPNGQHLACINASIYRESTDSSYSRVAGGLSGMIIGGIISVVGTLLWATI